MTVVRHAGPVLRARRPLATYAAAMARDQRLAALAAVPLFSACTKRELQKLARAGDELNVEAGRKLVDQGATGREAFFILDGQATVRRGNRKIATFGPGDYFGELALLDHQPRTASVTADTPMKVYVLDSRHFEGVLDEIPGLARRLLGQLASRVRELDVKAYG
jgi:CRP/FNR family transcriptional regulator, cyclic AMP receptor protein